MAYNWHSFVYQADEWIVVYACNPSPTISTSLFTIGHAVELYLKAAHVRLFGDVQGAIRYGHALRKLWFDLKAKDASFMSSYVLREKMFDLDLLDGSSSEGLGFEDKMHLLHMQNIYFILKHLPDIKYWGLPWKTRPQKPAAFGFVTCDPGWISFLREFRTWMGYPTGDQGDRIQQILIMNELPINATHFLNEIISSKA